MSDESKKTKLTLTVRKDIIDTAKRKAKEQGVSISRLFEKILERETRLEKEKLERKKAVTEFLKFMENVEPVDALPESDKDSYHRHLDEKYG